MKSLLNWVKGLFTDAVKVFLNAVFTKARTEVISALKDIAMDAVLEAQNTGLSNDEKRKKVFDTIKAFAVSRGIQAKDNIISLVIEMCVASLKG